jgi:hypothetical protein
MIESFSYTFEGEPPEFEPLWEAGCGVRFDAPQAITVFGAGDAVAAARELLGLTAATAEELKAVREGDETEE